MFTIIAGSEFMIAVIVVKSESSKTLVTLSLSRRKQQHVPGIARPCGPQVLRGLQTTRSITQHCTVQAASGPSQGQPGSCDANV